MKAWSHSALKSFELCPKKYYLESVEKRYNEAPGEAMVWGSSVHKAFEMFFKRGSKFPIGMKQFEVLAGALKERAVGSEVMVETRLALDADFQPAGFFDKSVWVRAVVDYGFVKNNVAVIFDWKTGKKNPSDDQLALMAALMFAQDSDIKMVIASFVWLQEPMGRQLATLTFERAELTDMWNRFLPRVREFHKAFALEEFPTRPNGLCRRWCPVTSCPHHGE